VTVTVTDANGASATSSQSINVASALAVSFTESPVSPQVNPGRRRSQLRPAEVRDSKLQLDIRRRWNINRQPCNPHLLHRWGRIGVSKLPLTLDGVRAIFESELLQ